MNRLLVLFFLLSFNVFPQFKLMDEKQEEETFKKIHRPSTENKLSNFLKQHIKPEEIIALSYKTSPNISNSIRLQFEVTKNGRPWNFRIYTGNRELNKKLINLLKVFLKNEIPNLSSLFEAKNRIQLFSKEGARNIINASSVIVSDYPPRFNNRIVKSQNSKKVLDANSSISDVFKKYPISGNCENITYSNAYGCFKNYFERFIIKNLNYNLIKEEQVIGELKMNISFKIDAIGNLNNIECYSLNENIEKEIKRILKLFQSEINGPAKRNGVAIESLIREKITLYVKESFTEKEISNLRNNGFTKFFQQKLSVIDVNSINLNHKKPVIKLFFNFDIEGRLYNIWTNTKNYKLNNKIIKSFKKYLLNTLNVDKSMNKIYSLAIIRSINEEKQVLCDSELNWTSLGYFKKCYNCNNIDDLKKNNIFTLQNYIISEFNSKSTSYKLVKGDISSVKPIINMKLYVSQDGAIKTSFVVLIDRISTTNIENPIINQINSIIENMPKYLNPPMNNKISSRAEIGNMAFKLLDKS